MKKLAIIGASYLQRPLVEKAKEMGLYTICFAWAEGAVCKDIADKFYPISIVEKDEILRICQEEQINGICTVASDVAAPTVAYVANSMGLPGNNYESAIRANNKYLMRRALSEAGVPCPQFRCVTDATSETIDSLQQELELPLIIKPSDRSGSLGVTKVADWSQLSSAILLALDKSFAHEAMVEEFIDGREISVEFISYKGNHYPLQITDKVTTEAPHFVELEHHQPAALSKDKFEEIYSITKRALIALGLTDGASHAEYKITPSGRIAVMEIGGRMGGDFIGSDLVCLSTGYDFLRGVIEVAMGEFSDPVLPFKKYSGVYFLSAETPQVLSYIKAADRVPEIVAAEQTDLELRHITCSSERSGYFIYQSNEKFDIVR